MGLFSFLSGKRNFGQVQVFLCESYKDVANDVLFRLVDDPDNIIRIKQEYSLAAPKDWEIADDEWNLQVAGVSYRIEDVMCFMAGQSRKIRLAQEPMPKFPHAIAVYGEWVDERNKTQQALLGYLPDTYAKKITKQIAKQKDYLLFGKLSKMFIPAGDKQTPGLRIDVAIFRPALPSFEVHGYGRDTGRKRKRIYIAKDEEGAILEAQKDGIIVEVDKIRRL